jgi:hypothetical protein
VGGGDSSSELLADGKDGKTRTAAVFSDKVRVGRKRKLRRKCT